MRKLFPAVAASLLAGAVVVTAYLAPGGEARAMQQGQGPELVRYGDVIIDLTRVVAVSHQKDESIRFTLDLGRPDGTAVEIVLSKEMSPEKDYIEQQWLHVVKDLRVSR